MVKVTMPLGSETAHGAIGEAIVFQGTTARQYVKPRDARTEAQISLRDAFRDVTKILSRCGDFPRAVFRLEHGGRWFTFLSGRVRGNWSNAYQSAVTEFDAWPEGSRLEWDAASPFAPDTEGIGRVFYGLVMTCYFSQYYGSGKMWGMKQWEITDAAAASAWWTDEVSQAFLPGLFDDTDARIKYSEAWGTFADVNAIEGNIHIGAVDDETNCQFFFIGSVLKIYYPTWTDGGVMRVIIDGTENNFSHSGSNGAFGSVWTSNPLTNGLHEVDIRLSGLGTIAIDAVEIE